MSINQIQEIAKFPGTRDWLNSRVDDLKIYSQLNYDIENADVGDILEINGSLQPTWVPPSAITGSTLDHMMVKPIVFDFVHGVDLPIVFNSIPLITSPNIIIDGNRDLVITQSGVYMFFVNYNVSITSTSENPVLTLQRYNPSTGVFVNDGDALGVSAVIPQSGATLGLQTLTASWPVIVPSSSPSNNRFRMIGSNPGTQTCSLNIATSAFTVVRIS